MKRHPAAQYFLLTSATCVGLALLGMLVNILGMLIGGPRGWPINMMALVVLPLLGSAISLVILAILEVVIPEFRKESE